MTTSSQKTDPIADSLDMTPLKAEVVEVLPHEIVPEADDGNYSIARENLLKLANTGQAALDEIMSIADQSQAPRAYEVVATLISNLTTVNDKLLDIAKKHREITGVAAGPKTVNNNVFVGSTAELQKMLKEIAKNGTANDVVPREPES